MKQIWILKRQNIQKVQLQDLSKLHFSCIKNKQKDTLIKQELLKSSLQAPQVIVSQNNSKGFLRSPIKSYQSRI